MPKNNPTAVRLSPAHLAQADKYREQHDLPTRHAAIVAAFEKGSGYKNPKARVPKPKPSVIAEPQPEPTRSRWDFGLQFGPAPVKPGDRLKGEKADKPGRATPKGRQARKTS